MAFQFQRSKPNPAEFYSPNLISSKKLLPNLMKKKVKLDELNRNRFHIFEDKFSNFRHKRVRCLAAVIITILPIIQIHMYE